MVNISKTFSVLVCPIYDLTIETFSSTDRQDKTARGEWTCLLPIYDVSERWAISLPPGRGRRMDLALPIPTIQCKCQRPTEDRRRESQFREFPVSARRASQDRRLYGRTSVVVVGRIPLSGSPKWPEMRGRHTGSEPIERSD